MLEHIGTPVKLNDHLMQAVFAPYRLENFNQHIVIFKNPFSPPYGEFYALSSKTFSKFHKDKKIIIRLLQDTYLEYWKCPEVLRQKQFLVSHSYCLTAYYTDQIMEDLLCLFSQVIIHSVFQKNSNEACMIFSVSLPNVYFDKVYEIVETQIKHDGVSYVMRTFQPALYIRISSNNDFVQQCT